ncbi:hypothetical protein SLA2020_165010 [Shorea laevis]
MLGLVTQACDPSGGNKVMWKVFDGLLAFTHGFRGTEQPLAFGYIPLVRGRKYGSRCMLRRGVKIVAGLSEQQRVPCPRWSQPAHLTLNHHLFVLKQRL